MLKKIVSGGQTGVDRAALDAAIDCNFPYGGYVPKGRIAEDGVIPSKYSSLTELKNKDYVVRTRKNIEHSDGTVVIYKGKFGRGTKYTINYAKKVGKPLLEIDMSKLSVEQAVASIKSFIEKNEIQVLNVAGPRLSKSPEIYSLAYEIVKSIL